jgi:hypothetical protein
LLTLLPEILDSPAIHRAQFTAHNSPRTIHRAQFIVAQFTAHNSPAQFTAAQFTAAQFTIHGAQFIAHNSSRHKSPRTIHREKIKIPLDEFSILLDDC